MTAKKHTYNYEADGAMLREGDSVHHIPLHGTEFYLASDYAALEARTRELEAALRWATTELMNADASTEDDVSRVPEAIHATIVSVTTPLETKDVG